MRSYRCGKSVYFVDRFQYMRLKSFCTGGLSALKRTVHPPSPHRMPYLLDNEPLVYFLAAQDACFVPFNGGNYNLIGLPRLRTILWTR